MKKALMVVGIAAAVFILLAVVIGVTTTNSAGPLTTGQTTEAPTESPAVPEVKEGVYQVGVDVPAGRYKTPGADYCYWERMRDDTGDFDSTIANDVINGPGSVTIRNGEFVKFSGECVWTLTP